MKQTLKKVFALFLVATMLFQVNSITSYADGLGDINASSSSTKTGEGLSGGPSSMKTGVYVTVSVGDSDSSPSKAIGGGIIFKTKGGQNIPAFSIESQSKINGNHRINYLEAPWPYPSFRAGSNAAGYGETITNWCKNTTNPATGNKWAVDILHKCGVTTEKVNEYIANHQNVYLNFEPIMFCNSYGSTKASKGPIIVGLVSGIASQIPDSKTYISSVTRSGFPKAFMYQPTKNWQGISGVSAPSGLVSLADMKNKTLGYGICSIKINQGLQLVIVVADESGKCNTEYTTTDKVYQVLQKYNGAEFQKGTFSTKKTTLTDPNATYDAVCSSGSPNRSVSVGTQTFNLDNKEEALFLYYKGEIDDPETNESELKAWETSYQHPNFISEREDGHEDEIDTEYTLKDHIEKVIRKVEGYTMACPHNDDYEHATATGSAVIDKVTCNDNEDWENETYDISANLGKYPHSFWNLYRESVSGEKWDTFSNALGDSTRWTINEPVAPAFSYMLTRSHLEKVSVSPDREGAGELCAEYNVSPNYDFEISYIGSQGKEQKANTTGTYDTDQYVYKFTAVDYNLCIYFHFEHDDVHWEEGETADWDNDPETPDTYEVTDSEDHPAHSFNAEGDDWSSEDDSSTEEENSYSPSKWKGNTGNKHQEDKYKTKPMPSGKNTRAGDVVDEQRGTELKGDFVKGNSFDYKPITAQLVGSEFRDYSFNIYPEVAMTLWASSDAETYTEPTEKLVYVMGEYKRTFTPSVMHSYKTSMTKSQMEGIGTLASAAVGSAASKVPSYDLGVTAMGTTFEIATQTQYVMDIYTVGCTLTESEAHDEWGNEATDVAASHEEYVSSILAGMRQEILMKMESDKFDKDYYYVLLSSESNLVRKDDPVQKTDIYFHSGAYDEEETVKGWCDTAWGIGEDAYSEAFQFTSDKILDTMFVSCTDGEEDNASQQYNPDVYVGTPLGGVLEEHGEHWYDEETKGKLRVEFYHSHIVFGQMNADDKVDYNLLTQDAHSRLIGETDNIHVSFYTRLFNDEEYTSADGFTWGSKDEDKHTGTYRIDQLKETDFSIINQTTAQMKSN